QFPPTMSLTERRTAFTRSAINLIRLVSTDSRNSKASELRKLNGPERSSFAAAICLELAAQIFWQHASIGSDAEKVCASSTTCSARLHTQLTSLLAYSTWLKKTCRESIMLQIPMTVRALHSSLMKRLRKRIWTLA